MLLQGREACSLASCHQQSSQGWGRNACAPGAGLQGWGAPELVGGGGRGRQRLRRPQLGSALLRDSGNPSLFVRPPSGLPEEQRFHWSVSTLSFIYFPGNRERSWEPRSPAAWDTGKGSLGREKKVKGPLYGPFPAPSAQEDREHQITQSRWQVASALTRSRAHSLLKRLHADHLSGAKVRKRSKTRLLPPRRSQSLGGDLGRALVTTQSGESWDGDAASEGRRFPGAHGRPCREDSTKGQHKRSGAGPPGPSNENPGCHCGVAGRGGRSFRTRPWLWALHTETETGIRVAGGCCSESG